MTEPEGPRPFSEHLLEYLRDPTLWPVAIVALAIFVTLVAAVLLMALRAGNRLGVIALVALVGITLDAVVRELRARGPGPVCGFAAALWALSGGAAAGAAAMGWF